MHQVSKCSEQIVWGVSSEIFSRQELLVCLKICPRIGEVPSGMNNHCVMSEKSEVTYEDGKKNSPEFGKLRR